MFLCGLDLSLLFCLSWWESSLEQREVGGKLTQSELKEVLGRLALVIDPGPELIEAMGKFTGLEQREVVDKLTHLLLRYVLGMLVMEFTGESSALLLKSMASEGVLVGTLTDILDFLTNLNSFSTSFHSFLSSICLFVLYLF